MLERKRKLLSQVILFGVFSALCGFGIYYRLTTKMSDYTSADITIVKGTLKQKPFIQSTSKGDKTLEIELNEYKDVVFSSNGIYLAPINYKHVVRENNTNDSIQISILKSDNLISSVDILGLKTPTAVYLTLTKLNKNLAIERPLQDSILYPLTIILLMLFIYKLIQFIYKDYNGSYLDSDELA